MANTFKNSVGTASIAGTAIHTTGASATDVLIGINLANKTGSAVTASVTLGSTYIIKDVNVPTGSSLSILDGKIVSESSEALTAYCSADSSLDVIVSLMEQT